MAKKPAPIPGPPKAKLTFEAIRTSPKVGLGPYAITANGTAGVVGLDTEDIDKMMANLQREGAIIKYNEIYPKPRTKK